MMTEAEALAAAREIDRASGVVAVHPQAPPWELARAVEDVLGMHGICAAGRIMRLHGDAFVTMTTADIEWAVGHFCQFWLPRAAGRNADGTVRCAWDRVAYPPKNIARELIARARGRTSMLPTPNDLYQRAGLA